MDALLGQALGQVRSRCLPFACPGVPVGMMGGHNGMPAPSTQHCCSQKEYFGGYTSVIHFVLVTASGWAHTLTSSPSAFDFFFFQFVHGCPSTAAVGQGLQPQQDQGSLTHPTPELKLHTGNLARSSQLYLKLHFGICRLLMRLKNSVTGNDNCSLSNIKQILASLGVSREAVISDIERAKAMSNMILIRQWVLYLPT